MKLTISMITLNEERAVAKVVGDIRGVVPDAEIFLVDSSKDRTAEIATELGCRVFKQFPPKGYGPAMDRAVRDAAGDIVITLDCDDTYPVETIPTMVALIDEGYDLVNATRLAKRPKAMPFANYLANRIFAWTARLFHGIRTTERASAASGHARDPVPHGLPRRRDSDRIPRPHRRIDAAALELDGVDV
jgi:glycosyltransferase involved in cell wall biosynthesis